MSMLLAIAMLLSMSFEGVSVEKDINNVPTGLLSDGDKVSAEEQVDTRSRGYQLIDGDVYDLNGNLLIKMHDGFTLDGYTLDPNFTVYYPDNNVPIDNEVSDSDDNKASAEEQVDTKSRGYLLKDGDVYDLNDNLLIKMHDGFTPDGFTLDPNFTVHDPNTYVPIDFDEVSPKWNTIFNGTMYSALNTDGNQGTQLGSDFIVSSSEPTSRLAYYSGTPSGVNFSVYNVTRNTLVHWVPNVQPGYYSKDVFVYNSSRPDDQYRAKASAVGSAGNATLQVVIPNTKTDTKTEE